MSVSSSVKSPMSRKKWLVFWCYPIFSIICAEIGFKIYSHVGLFGGDVWQNILWLCSLPALSTFGSISFALWLFVLRQRVRWLYATLEMAFGAAIAFGVALQLETTNFYGQSASTLPFQKPLLIAVQVGACIYVIVRGFDNFDQASVRPRVRCVWEAISLQ